MKKLRLVLLAALVAVAAYVARDYFASREVQAERQAVAPAAIASDLSSETGRWNWTQQSGDSAKVEIWAEHFQQGTDDSAIDLSGVELHIYHVGEQELDRIESAAATFDIAANTFRSQADVLITLAVPADDPQSQAPELTRIRTSGVTFNTLAGTASTDEPVEYEFHGGRAHSRGGYYDSPNGYFRMNSEARVERFASGPGSPATIIEAGELIYQEDAERVELHGGARLLRGDSEIEGRDALVFLKDGGTERIEAFEAKGSNRREGRLTRFHAPWLEVRYRPDQTIEQVQGSDGAELTSTSSTTRIEARAESVRLHYRTPLGADEGLLEKTFLIRNASIDSYSRSMGSDAEDLRRVESQAILLRMGEGGEEIASIETTEPGRLNITPADPTALRRVLSAAVIRADYAAGNRLRKLEAHGAAALETIAPPGSERDGLRSWSEHLSADFDLASGELARLEQTGDFRFEQPGRSGRAVKAEYLPASERLDLEGDAKIHNATGSVAANRIGLKEGQGSLHAHGAVRTRYLQEQVGESTSPDDLFAASEPVFATAEEMRSDQESGLIEYSGGARLWQGSNRIEGDRIFIDRGKDTLRAEGETHSSLVESEAGPGAAGRIDVVAGSLLYVGEERTARYRGDVKLERGSLKVSAAELDIRFSPAGVPGQGESPRSLEEAIARGEVRIVDAVAGSAEQRRGFGEFLRYLPGQDLALLRGSPARVSNERDEETRGGELTYRISDDSLRVSGKPNERAYTFRNR